VLATLRPLLLGLGLLGILAGLGVSAYAYAAADRDGVGADGPLIVRGLVVAAIGGVVAAAGWSMPRRRTTEKLTAAQPSTGLHKEAGHEDRHRR
jgi:hypothetical protein